MPLRADRCMDDRLFQIDSVEFAQMEKRVFDGLKAGNEVLKEIHAEMSVEAVEELMADTKEALAFQQVCTRIVHD